MPDEKARYVIPEPGVVEEAVLLTAPVAEWDVEYFTDEIVPTLRPLSDEEYMHGPAYILSSFAHYSYVLYKQDVYWCVEWDPGLIVIRLSPDGTMAWNAFRSPIPDFGGRAPQQEDVDSYDEDEENYQYNLVFDAWDVQFEGENPGRRGFKRASQEDADAYAAALSHVQALGDQLKDRYSEDGRFAQWREECVSNLTLWAGDGLRIVLEES